MIAGARWRGGPGRLLERTRIRPSRSSPTRLRSTRPGTANRGRGSRRRRVPRLLGEDGRAREPGLDPAAARSTRRCRGSARSGPRSPRPDGRVDAAGLAIGLYDPAAPVDAAASRPTATATTARSPARARSRRSAWTACWSAAPTSSGSAASRRPTAASSRTSTSACGFAELGLSIVCAPAPRTDRPRDRGAAALGLRRARPRPLRRPLVRAARGRRPLLQPALLPRGRRLLAPARSTADPQELAMREAVG